MDKLIEALQIADSNEVGRQLDAFNVKYGQLFIINEPEDKKKELLDGLFRLLRSPEQSALHHKTLSAMVVITRDQSNLNELFTADRIETLLHLAKLVGEDETLMTSGTFDCLVVVGAQKCLYNLIYNSPTIQKLCGNNRCIEGIMLRLRMHPDPQLPQQVKYFDMRMLSLISARCPEVSQRIWDQFHPLIYLIEAIDWILKNNVEGWSKKLPNNERRSKGLTKRKNNEENGSELSEDDYLVAYCLDDWKIDLAIEILNVLFNLTRNLDNHNLDDIEEAHFHRLVSHLRDLLLCETRKSDRRKHLQSHTIHLLTNMPSSSLEKLMSPITKLGKPENLDHNYSEMNMDAIAVLLKFLEKRLDSQTTQNMIERLVPILTCLCMAVRANTVIRKYLRRKILPPLRVFTNRPEDGPTLRNRLVKLMTAPHTDVKKLSADLLFVLCKGNVARLIKYTGYGNAAGLLASRGLMLGGRSNLGEYSSDSEESDTEEYHKCKDKINPVTGCYEEPHPNPLLESMPEEQKEFETMKLVDMMDKLAKTGVVQPCRIGEDGRPRPVEHVLELAESAEDQLKSADK